MKENKPKCLNVINYYNKLHERTYSHAYLNRFRFCVHLSDRILIQGLQAVP